MIGGVSRLARFNISHDPQPRNPGRADRKYFVGMPIPAAAGLLAATVHLCYGYPVQAWWVAILWIILVGLSGFLMVSTWRFWSAKEINFSRSHPFQLLFAAGDRAVYHDPLLEVVLFAMGAGVYVLWHLGTGGVLVVAATALTAGAALSEQPRNNARRGAGIVRMHPVNFHSSKEGCLCTRLLLPEPRRCWAGN